MIMDNNSNNYDGISFNKNNVNNEVTLIIKTMITITAVSIAI